LIVRASIVRKIVAERFTTGVAIEDFWQSFHKCADSRPTQPSREMAIGVVAFGDALKLNLCIDCDRQAVQLELAMRAEFFLRC